LRSHRKGQRFESSIAHFQKPRKDLNLATVDLKTQLSALIKLQSFDSEIYKLKNILELKPQELKEAEAIFESKKQTLLELEKNALDLQKQKKERELELATKEESVTKLKSQLSALKTNKEYQIMLKQIDGAKADGSVIEDKILQLFDLIDKAKTDTEQEKIRLKDDTLIFNEQKKKNDDQIKLINEQIALLEEKRKQILPEVEVKLLAQYEKILQNRFGLAIVPVKDNSCQGCNMFTPAQVHNLIKMYDYIVTCENCNRMLYIEEEHS
jgi:uncharacterized protein